MRVTDRMMFDRATRDAGRARDRLDQAVALSSTGQQLVHPGDDPGGAALVALDRARAARLDAIAATAGRAADELQVADGALSDVTNGIARARELAVQLSNATYGAGERAAGAKEVRGILAAAIGSLNTRMGDRYVFGGRADRGVAPFTAAGTYVGDAGARQVEIAPGVVQDASARADVAVAGAGGGTDVLATLDRLAAALEANDADAARATLDGLAAGTSQLARARGELGAAMATFNAAKAANEAGRDDAKAAVSHLADADPIEAASQLQLAQHALDAALTAVAQGFQLTLVDKLR